MAFKKQLVTSCKQAIWGEILGGNAPNYAQYSQSEFGEYVRTISILTTAIVLHRARIIIISIRYFERNGG